ncbi:AAA family ATPase [Kineococcus rhizosphaerae]|uniref:AAA family ATPase n=1 Tax=Kineococcus rhizosphaerae TaxID=559628 RepID=UPI001FE3ED26|nr:ATP-binding cassette domain-containing protein [Kineococcus rhizosphaerae]
MTATVTGRPRPDRLVRRVQPLPGTAPDPGTWPDTVPAVAQLLTRGLDLPAGVTFLVGENGAGKSTLVEAVAQAVGVPAEGGLRRHAPGRDEPQVDASGLGDRLQVVRGTSRFREAFFLRAETMHRFYSWLREVGSEAHSGLHELSHGESFLDVLGAGWMRHVGLLLLDEPESALSFGNQLVLGAAFARMAAEGRQVLCATHSPLLTALPGARILQVDGNGLTRVDDWEDLAVVRDWRFFLDAPDRYWRRVLD